MSTESSPAAVEGIESFIRTIRGRKVLLDSDLARIYGVPTKRLNEQVRRNLDRFPDDFMFQLTPEEVDSLRSQIATLKLGRGDQHKHLPHAFTEHGAIMAANILNSPQAVCRLPSEICNLKSSEAWPPLKPEPPRRQIGFHARPDDETAGATKGRKR